MILISDFISGDEGFVHQRFMRSGFDETGRADCGDGAARDVRYCRARKKGALHCAVLNQPCTPIVASGYGREERIRTSGPCLPKAVLYQAELLPDGVRRAAQQATTISLEAGLYRARSPRASISETRCFSRPRRAILSTNVAPAAAVASATNANGCKSPAGSAGAPPGPIHPARSAAAGRAGRSP